MKYIFLFLISFLLLFGCSTTSDSRFEAPELYFPPIQGAQWETTSLQQLGWKEQSLPALLDYLEEKNTKGFIILVNGKIAVEAYFNGHGPLTPWYWASAGKTLTASIVGIAQQEGYLSVTDRTSDYIGSGWTVAPTDKENLITIRHQLTMTTGLNESINNLCILPECMPYLADAGTRWSYHNGPYTLLRDVVTQATGKDFNTYFDEKIKSKIGMQGQFINVDNYMLYFSNTRSMARFGLLCLNKGKWEEEQLINTTYFNEMIHVSQELNPSYGYLWWINSGNGAIIPGQINVPGKLIPSAPDDMFMGLGFNDQKLYIAPEKKIVVIRMGEAANEENMALSEFDVTLWDYIKALYEPD